MVLVLLSSSALAVTITGQAGKTIDLQQTEDGDLVVVQEQTQERAQTSTELEDSVEDKELELEQELAGKSRDEKEILKNQNEIRLAVHAFLAMEDLVGSVGKQISAIAREFDNSIQATINAEERIASRSSLAKMFIGGDQEAAEDLEEEVKSNKVRIETLKRLKDECKCGPEVKELFREQVESMEQEVNRLGELAKDEKDSKGLFGWLWK